MIKKTAGISMMVALVAMLAAGSALARGGRGMGPDKGMGPGFGPGMAALNLSAEQQQKLSELRAAHIKQVAPLRADMRVKRAELQALFTAEKLDQKAIKAKQAEINALRDKLGNIRIEHRLQVSQILTPEQRAQWANRPGRGMGFGKGRGMGRGCGGGHGHGRGGGPGGW